MDETLRTADYYWHSLTSEIAEWMPNMFSTSTITRQLESRTDESDLDFNNLMKAAGFSVKSIKMGMSAYPKFSLNFGQKREISEADVIHVNRLLRKHARSTFGPVGAAQRLIVSTVLDINSFPEYNLKNVDVTMLPFPSVDFYVEPRGPSFESDPIDLINGRINDVNKKLEKLVN
jgi:hypothetical protein